MKIFIVEYSIHYESHILGAYSTKARAESEERAWIKANPDNNGTSIIEVILDQ